MGRKNVGQRRLLEVAKEVNALVVRGERVFNVPNELKQSVTSYLRVHWGLRQKPCAEPIGGMTVVLQSSLDDQEVVLDGFMSETNPFLSPSEAKKKSLKAVAEQAEQINTGLAEGQRTFLVPIGTAKAVREFLLAAHSTDETPWKVKLTPCLDSMQNPNASTNFRKLVVTHPDDELNEET